jgi:hypothetical protein
MKVQMTREDWEKSGPYDSCMNCPGATMASRIAGSELWSMSWHHYYHPDNRKGKWIRTKDAFNVDTYREAKRRYDAGETVLFETETL